MKKRIMCVVGTRPEAIKMAPVICALKNEPWVEVRVLATAQHRQMLDQVLEYFGIVPDIDLNVMRPNQTLAGLTARLLNDIDDVLQAEQPDVVLVQGDTTTVMTVAIACFYRRIQVGHVEAGLRTWDMNNPFPEEANRVIVGKLARWHFAPTEKSRQNLIEEHVPVENILVTGNTVIDALHQTVAKEFDHELNLSAETRLVLITAHRRENFGEPFSNICAAIVELARKNPDVQFLYPVHPNPNIKDIAYAALSNISNVTLCAPLDYAPFVAVMNRSYLILTDSGGVQEEGPALGKPVLVLREETERPEAVDAGVVKLVGTDTARIVKETQSLLDDVTKYNSIARGVSPYGDGHAAERIIAELARCLNN